MASANATNSYCCESGGDDKYFAGVMTDVNDVAKYLSWFRSTPESFQQEMKADSPKLSEKELAHILYVQEMMNILDTHLELKMLGPDDDVLEPPAKMARTTTSA